MRKCFPALLLLATASCAVVRPLAPAPAPGYVVFFDEKSADLPRDALATVQQAAAAAKAHPDEAVALIGYTDSAGSAAADSVLSEKRAKCVADALVADGVPAARITRQGRGQTHGEPGVESRRVEIRIGT
jgi:outer membrane protein OmpA-like peptidoglycan-associated protein